MSLSYLQILPILEVEFRVVCHLQDFVKRKPQESCATISMINLPLSRYNKNTHKTEKKVLGTTKAHPKYPSLLLIATGNLSEFPCLHWDSTADRSELCDTQLLKFNH